jgi:hypothetical protein
MTDAERLLWRYLRNREFDGWKFRRVSLLSILSAWKRTLSLKWMADNMPMTRNLA